MLNKTERRDAGIKLTALAREATRGAEKLLADAVAAVRAHVSVDGELVDRLFDREQRATHALAWIATYVEALRQLSDYAERMHAAGTLGEIEELIVSLGVGEYLEQIAGGIPMNLGEIARPGDCWLSLDAVSAAIAHPLQSLATGRVERRARLVELLSTHHDATVGECGLEETLDTIRGEMRKFADGHVMPHAQEWHRTNSYIPSEIIAQMSELGVFGLTIAEENGGLGLGKESMCVVSEELSRGYIGVGSLGTRSEIAAELISGSGTEEQKRKWLARIASGEVLPTAVFTEPNAGSDLASLRTRAVRKGNVYKVYGNKTWITHPVRADLMTLLVRTNPNEPGTGGFPCCSRKSRAARTPSRFRRPACRAARSRCSAIAA